MKTINFCFILGLNIISFYGCEKENKSPGHGAFGSQILTIGMIEWNINEVKVFSGTQGVILDAIVRGGELKRARIVMSDTVNNVILYENKLNTFPSDLFFIKDTVFISNIIDTIFAKIQIEGIDANEVDVKQWRLKIIK